MSDEVLYRSKVQVVRIKGSYRRATIPAEENPVYFSVHSEIAQHYKVDNAVIPVHAATLDYVVAAAAG